MPKVHCSILRRREQEVVFAPAKVKDLVLVAVILAHRERKENRRRDMRVVVVVMGVVIGIGAMVGICAVS